MDERLYFASYYDNEDAVVDVVLGDEYYRFRIGGASVMPCLGCGDDSAFIVCSGCLKMVRHFYSRENQADMLREILFSVGDYGEEEVAS